MSDFVFALRQAVRHPAMSLAAMLTLGLGLAASLAVFTLVNAVLLRPLPYPESERLMAIGRGAAPAGQSGSHRDVRFLREHLRTCAPVAAAVGGSGLNVAFAGLVSHEDDLLVSRGYFDALGVQPSWGRAFTVEEDADSPPPVAILNERFLRRHGLDPAATVGREIRLGGRAFTVVGVLASRHTLPSDPDIYRPLGNDARGGGQNLQMLCRLTAGSTPAALDAELAGLIDEARRAELIAPRTTVAYSAATRHEWEYGSVRPALLTLMAAVVLVLLVAGANTTGLLLVQAAARRREIAVRTALGASPARIARTLLVEGLVLTAFAGLFGVAIAPLFVRGLLAVAPTYYAELASFTLDRTVAAVAGGLCAVVGLAISVPPLAECLRLNLRDALHEEGRSGTMSRRGVWIRHALIGAETAACAVLLVGALLLLRTFVNLMNTPTGFDAEHVIEARMSVQGPRYDEAAQLIRFFEDGVARLEQMPAVQGAAVGASLPAERALNLSATLPDTSEPNEVRIINWRYVTPGYFDVLRIRQVAGRPFAATDRAGAPAVAMVNESFARQMYGGAQQALSRRVSVARQLEREIVGVVSDTTGWSLADTARPMLFVPLAQVEPVLLRTAHSFFPPRWILRSALDAEGARRVLQQVVSELDPSQPFIEVRPLESLMVSSVSVQRFYLVVLAAFALFAVLLAAVGVYATYSYAVASRTTEIGVRLALGASPRRILWGIVGRASALGGTATVAGLALAAGLARVLEAVLFSVASTDPLTYAAVATVLMTTVVVATLVPARRAARIDPLVAIRSAQ
jgi:predicted permease